MTAVFSIREERKECSKFYLGLAALRRIGCTLLIAVVVMAGFWINAKPQRSKAPTPPAGSEEAEEIGMRYRYEAQLRGVSHGIPALARSRAVAETAAMPAFAGTWNFIGPDSITNGQGLSSNSVTCSTPELPCPDGSRRLL